MRIIPRRIVKKRIENSFPWVMVYGRRKTGKTFLIENFVKHDRFFFVNRDGTILDKKTGDTYTPNEFQRIFREIIEERTVVIDEFHRLPGKFMDYLHSLGTRGNLILITSTLHLAESLLRKGEPLLGLVRPVKIDLVDEREILSALAEEFRGKELVENSVYLREVMLIPSFRGNIENFLTNFLTEGKVVVKELIGEVFTEEERRLTNIYEGIMKAVATSKNVSTEISTFLFSRGILPKDNPGILQKYLKNLVQMGILEKVKVFGKKRFKYFHKSPLLDLHYYLEGKYSYTEVETPRRFVKAVIKEKLPLHVESFFKSLLTKVFGLQPTIIEEKDLEIDIALLEFKRPRVLAEVKWKNFVPKEEGRRVEEKLRRFRGVRKILIVPREESLEVKPESIEVWDVEKTLEVCRKSTRKIELP